MSLSLAPRIRDVAIGKIESLIADQTHALIRGFAEDYADYRNRVGVIQGMERAVEEIELSCKLVIGD